MITTKQIKIIHTILPVEIKDDTEAKAQLISQFTGSEQKRSTKDLTSIQATELIQFLSTHNMPCMARYAYFDKTNKQHRYLLSMSIQLGWSKLHRGKVIADLERLGSWIYKVGYLHIPLLEYKPEDLSRLVYQFEQVLQNSY